MITTPEAALEAAARSIRTLEHFYMVQTGNGFETSRGGAFVFDTDAIAAIRAIPITPVSPDVLKLTVMLRTKSAMINLGEKIAWGSETALMDEAADTLARKDRELQAAQAEVERLKAALDEIDMRGLQYDAKDLADMARAALKGTSHE